MDCSHCGGCGHFAFVITWTNGDQEVKKSECRACHGTGRAEGSLGMAPDRVTMTVKEGERESMSFFRRIGKALPCAICKEPYPRMLRIADVIFCKGCLTRAMLDMGWVTDEQAEIIITQGLENREEGV